ncbi:MAG TPA: hypothetical protein VKZ75_09845 [Cyclobacteriaceae bacterium]|nr:hypothetical protein [Cyclobacteriaceae bacterium]
MEEAANIPLVCKLTTPELQKRKATVIAELRALVLERNELNDGYSYHFDGSDQNLDRLTEFIKTERMCCDFFTFRLIVNENAAVLDVCGPPGAKEFLEMEVGL